MSETIYILCTLTSLACARMLFKAYAQSRHRLLFWSVVPGFFALVPGAGGHRIYAALPSVSGAHEDSALHYSFRLLGYALILWAVLKKNGPRHKQPG